MTDPVVVPVNLLRSDAFLDRVLDKLAQRGERITDLARWDLKGALQDTLAEVHRP